MHNWQHQKKHIIYCTLFLYSTCPISVDSVSNGMPTMMIAGQVSIAFIDGEPAIFTPELNIDGSPEREAFLARIRPLVSYINKKKV